jgi:hypothetical protein
MGGRVSPREKGAMAPKRAVKMSGGRTEFGAYEAKTTGKKAL